MYLTRLSLTDFRNFARLDLEIPHGAQLLLGANAQGKTSVLEAIYFLSTFVSFHAENDRQLINFMAGRAPQAVARIVAHFSHRTGKHKLEVRIIQEPNGINGSTRTRKEVLLDGAKKKVGQLVGLFNTVLFQPQMLQIIEGSPDERRRFLNLTISQVVPDYAEALADYTRALTQRNALLKQLAERGGDVNQLDYWDDLLATSGAKLIFARIQALQELEQMAIAIHHELSRGEEILRLAYEPAYDPLPLPDRQLALPLDAPLDRSAILPEKIESGFRDCLQRLRGEEINRGVTTVGPHRDELRFLSNGRDLSSYGSRGQVRTAILSLKLAEVGWMQKKTGDWPVLLLDEVLAELDVQRRADLLTHLASCEQVIMTTTDLDLFKDHFIHDAHIWRVDDGRVSTFQVVAGS